MSHIGQDSWVAQILNFKKNGYFLDFGGFDGLMHSNTFYLEKFLSWEGIVVEPNPVPYASVCAVRSCITVNAALWKESRLSVEFTDSHGLSSFLQYQDCDSNAKMRKDISERIIHVDTINPNELLRRFNAPEYIDFLSLDVEGAEFDVIKEIDLNYYHIALMSIEHNHEKEKQSLIRNHLSQFDYEVVEHRNDDFFFHHEHLKVVSNGNYQDPMAIQRKVLGSYQLITY